MFATHPMSEERYQTAKNLAAIQFAAMQNAPIVRERYMDNTASLRRKKGAIEKCKVVNLYSINKILQLQRRILTKRCALRLAIMPV